ncbi:aminoglycoside phosphotransferase family protein [soil metagenome]
MPELRFEPLAKLVNTISPGAGAELNYTEMPGGASTRRYFRVSLAHGSAIGMFVPEGGKPEEIGKDHAPPRWPFLEVRDLLAEHGVDVPKILAENTEAGWLLLEDLGDDTLANYLLRDPGAKPRLYARAVSDLAAAQIALKKLPEGSVVGTRSFDHDLLKLEIDHFREWGLEARGHKLNDADRESFDRIAEALAKRIASWPRGFVHRDYQSRNLMVRDQETLCWIDFQDALLGPRIYDMVALLNDSYQEFDRAFVEERLAEYAEKTGLKGKAREALGREFDYMTVQRKLKDAGRFVFIDRTKKNSTFLRFVTPTVKKVSLSLERLAKDDPDMAELLALLRRVLPDEA